MGEKVGPIKQVSENHALWLLTQGEGFGKMQYRSAFVFLEMLSKLNFQILGRSKQVSLKKISAPSLLMRSSPSTGGPTSWSRPILSMRGTLTSSMACSSILPSSFQGTWQDGWRRGIWKDHHFHPDVTGSGSRYNTFIPGQKTSVAKAVSIMAHNS